jgi:hypothetical protein
VFEAHLEIKLGALQYEVNVFQTKAEGENSVEQSLRILG